MVWSLKAIKILPFQESHTQRDIFKILCMNHIHLRLWYDMYVGNDAEILDE